MMGCGSSMDTGSIEGDPRALNDVPGGFVTHWQPQNGVDPVGIVQEFVRLDERIAKLEATCPGPRMATCEAWTEHLQAKRDSMLGIDSIERFQQRQQQQQELQNGNIFIMNALSPPPYLSAEQPTTFPPGAVVVQANGALPLGNGAINGVGVSGHTTNISTTITTTTNNIVANTPTKDLANLALSLGVVNDVQKASTHEDFFANLSESALHLISIRYYTETLEHSKVRLKTLIENYAELNELYVNHDGIIAFISGGTYMSRLEESIDAQLETAREMRDKLGSTLEQWHICGTLLQTCAKASAHGLQQWHQLPKISNAKEKIHAAMDCRNSWQAALVALDCAQLALPHVEIKYLSNRQTVAVQHCNTYLITDIASVPRYEHTTKVLTTFEGNVAKAYSWLHDTFNNSLRQDFDKAEEAVRTLANNLRDHREEMFTAARN